MTALNLFKKMLILLFILVTSFYDTYCQQVPDTLFSYQIQLPQYLKGSGPMIFIDQAHNNFHTREGGFLPFAKLLEQDGYQVSGLNSMILSSDILKNCKILVIANALDSINVNQWVNPVISAFTDIEIENIVSWVQNGGSLLLIADHMPFAGAAAGLARAFGFEFVNGFAFTGNRNWPPSSFSLSDSTLIDSPIANGRIDIEKIDFVATFTGSAFRAPEGALPILSFLNENYSLQPDTAWSFNSQTPKISLDGYLQGAVMNFGNGRVAVFGEAAIFTAQIVNGNMKVGINSDVAPQNAQFTLNLIHWLDGLF